MDEREFDSRETLSRRRLLGVVASSTAATLAGCTWGDDSEEPSETSPTQSPTPGETQQRTPTDSTQTRLEALAENYSRVVNLSDAGADTEGNEDIVPYLNEQAGDDTLLYFPEGEYLFDDWFKLGTFTNFGLYGDGATLVPDPDYTSKPMLILGELSGSQNLHIEGLSFDFRDQGNVHQPLKALLEDGLVVRDLSVKGASGTVRFEITAEGGTGHVENLELPTGGPGGATGCFVGKPHRGTLTFKNCHIAGYPGNGIYASPANGPIRVIGGRYANNGIANVRVPGNSLVRDVTVACDTQDSSFRNMRGIWVKGPGTTIEGCTVRLKRVPGSDGGIVGDAAIHVRNTDIEIHADEVHAILGTNTNQRMAAGQSRSQSRFENVSISGTAAKSATIYMIQQDSCVFENVSVSQRGQNRDGFHFLNTTDAVLRKTDIDVTGKPVISEQSNIQKYDVITNSGTSRETNSRQ